MSGLQNPEFKNLKKVRRNQIKRKSYANYDRKLERKCRGKKQCILLEIHIGCNFPFDVFICKCYDAIDCFSFIVMRSQWMTSLQKYLKRETKLIRVKDLWKLQKIKRKGKDKQHCILL